MDITMLKQWTIFCAAALLTMGLFGCEAHSRYRVLCFLFDGVPVPRGEVPCDGQSLASVSGEGKNANTGKAVARNYIQHGPYAARLCEGCHQRQTNQLLMPANDLSLYCHVLSVMKKRVHGPVASGSCGVCHDAHGSGNEYLLVSQSQDFCLYCHQRQDVVNISAHQDMDATGCTTCHDAHASNNDHLLREAPNPNDDSSPWVNPKQKPPDKKLATTTAKADGSPSSRNKRKPDAAKLKPGKDQFENYKPLSNKGKEERISGKKVRSSKNDAWGNLITF
jgi:predicted CXXCH cytochrome family protein